MTNKAMKFWRIWLFAMVLSILILGGWLIHVLG